MELLERDGGVEDELPVIVRRVRHEDGISILELEGEVDLSTVPQLKEALDAALATGTDIIVDLSDVGFIDSSGYGTLLGATKQLRPSGKSVHLVGANTHIVRMMEITRLNTLLSVHESEEAARLVVSSASPAIPGT